MESVEYDFPADKVTGVATAEALIGGRFCVCVDAVSTAGLRMVSYPATKGQGHFLVKNDVAQDANMTLVRKGVWTMTAGDTITAPGAVMSDDVGRPIPASGAGYILGYALSDATVGVAVVIQLALPGYLQAA